ncbi:MAG: hypothetical protein GC147_08335 [Porphyrobacter sp.]|nr:hypothetical protein [Porphyrobacter sp.]
MNRLARLVAVALPLAGLAGLWATSERTYNQGTEWEVPIMGYDPRDVLRGHYVEFTFDWPISGEAVESGMQFLCLAGDPPKLASATPVADAAALAACPHPLRAAPDGVYGVTGLERGRLYVGQDRARALQAQLADRDQRGIVTIRQREDGSFTPVDIRFRPLTPQERAARENDNGRPEIPGPPAIMSR